MSDNELKIRDLRGAVRDAVSDGNRPTTPMDLLRVAMEKGIDPDKLKVFVDMAEKFQAEAKRAAYYDALARARATHPDILKNKRAGHDTKGGGRREWPYPSHDEVALKVADWMAPFGLACFWKTSQKDGMVTVTCRITHSAGHHEDFPMTAPEDTSGLKSSIQSIASTKTYLERYTLLAGLGLSSRELGDRDDDGSGPPKIYIETKAKQGYTPPKPTTPKPETFEVWKQHIETKAKQGYEALGIAWRTSPEDCKEYCKADDTEWAWWLRQKEAARAVPLQGDESIP